MLLYKQRALIEENYNLKEELKKLKKNELQPDEYDATMKSLSDRLEKLLT